MGGEQRLALTKIACSLFNIGNFVPPKKGSTIFTYTGHQEHCLKLLVKHVVLVKTVWLNISTHCHFRQ